jgi:phospholipid transport system transporter-binding protein
MNTIDISFENEVLFISGDLDFSNVMSLYEKSLPYLRQSQKLTVDFANLHSSNSASIALLLEWRKLAVASGKSIQFLHLPSDCLSIAKAAGLDSLLLRIA